MHLEMVEINCCNANFHANIANESAKVQTNRLYIMQTRDVRMRYSKQANNRIVNERCDTLMRARAKDRIS